MISVSVRNAAFALAAVAAVSLPAVAQAETRDFHLAAQGASSGVREFARQADIQITLASRDADGRDVNAVEGNLDVRTALEQLLDGTGLTIRSFDGKIAIIGAATRSSAVDADNAIVVTGSRIARPELQSAMPISVTKADDMIALGRTSVSQMLSSEPSLGIGLGLASSSTGVDSGIQAVNLRNLGTNRSLVLIDGQRRVSASATSSAVDMGMIPVGMIDRIEVVTGGAAAIYGADAVTGALNIVTKHDFKGIDIAITNGLSGEGDARQSMISFTTGAKFAGGRGSFVLGGTWSDTAPLYYTDRFGIGEQHYYATNPANTGPNDGIPDRIRINNVHQIYYDYRPTFFANGQHYIFDNNAVRIGQYDTQIGTRSWSDLGDGGDGRTLNDVSLIRARNKSKSLMGRYDFEVNDNITYGGYFSWARQNYEGHDGGNSIWRDDNRSVFFNGAGGSVARLDNPYLPDSIREFMVANDLKTLNIERSYGNFPQRTNTHDRESITIGQTLDGKLTDRLKWSLFYQYGRTHDDVTEGPVPWKDHWLAARDVIADPVTGQPVCRSAAARAEGCVPLNIFTQDAPSAELLNYVMASRHNERTNTQQIFGGSVSGALLRLPYGDMSIAAGVERRVERLHTTDDPLALNGQLVYCCALSAEPPLNVSTAVTEVYGEVVVPLFKDLPLIRRLELEGAFRHSEYRTIGGTNTWKVGGSWSPIEGLTFRALRSRSVRTPNFGELYSPQVTSLTGDIDDPCEAGSYYANSNRSKNCAALGMTTPLENYKTGPAVTTGGNSELKPETSNSLTLGMVFQPKFLPGFDMTLDYYDIDIAGAVQQLNYITLLRLCVDVDTIDNPFCARITRDPVTHQPTAIQSNQSNTARLYTRGIDFGLNYRRRIGEGLLRLSFKGNYLFDLVTETTPGVATGDVIADGGYRNPRFKGSLLTSYDLGKVSVSLNTRFISASTYDLTQVGHPEAYPTNKVPAMLYNDLAVQVRINDHYRIGAGVQNLTNTKAPDYPATYIDAEMYDLVGRYFYLTAGVKF